MGRTFRQGECTLIRSSDPTEIAIFYYVDGLPMSAVKDLTGRCLDAFLKRRLDWHRQMQASKMSYIANSIALQLLLRAGLTDGKGGPGRPFKVSSFARA